MKMFHFPLFRVHEMKLDLCSLCLEHTVSGERVCVRVMLQIFGLRRRKAKLCASNAPRLNRYMTSENSTDAHVSGERNNQ